MLKEYFYYSRIERNGAAILLTICIGLALAPSVYRLLILEQPPQFVTQNSLLAVAENEMDTEASFARNTKAEHEKMSKGKESRLFPFNPNEASVATLMQLGLSSKVAHTIDNYREKGGTFRTRADLRKIYGLSETDFKRLEPYISLPEQQNRKIARANALERAAELFEFDPNVASQEELQRLGLSPKVARTIVNYRNKGGTFRQKTDLQKIYGLSENDYNRLQAYIALPVKKPEIAKAAENVAEQPTSIPASYATVAKIDINAATAEEWQRLRGIGPAYSKRIVNFREALGGFANIDQIAQTYGLPDSTFQAIKPYLQISSKPITLNVNTASEEDLKKHPYISWKQAKVIVNYRSQHGAFTALEDLIKTKVISETDLHKLAAYLVLE